MDWIIKFYNVLDMTKNFSANKDALDAINKAIELDPQFTVPYVMRASLYGEVAKDYSKAIADMTTAIKCFAPSPNNPFENTSLFYETRAKYYFKNKKLSLALDDFMTALNIDPTQVLRSHSEYETLDINGLPKKLPKDFRSYVMRARFNSYFESQNDKERTYNNAIADARKAIKLNSKSYIAYYILAEALHFKAYWYDMGHVDMIDTVSHKAIVESATKALKLSLSKDWELRFLSTRAQEHLVLKQYALAIDDYKSVHPQNLWVDFRI